MAKYFLTNKAVDDLGEIWDYTYGTWSEKQADAYYGLLINACQAIAENPDIGRKYEEIGLGIKGFRVSKHILFYHIANKDRIEIIRVLHEQMDLKSRMGE